MDHPIVSVITPVYNAAVFLPRLFECVGSQNGVEVEHILVDDCSSDNSLQIMRGLAWGKESIKIISMPKNEGPVVARNLAIQQARGKYLAFLDADDYWLPNKSLVQSRFMEETGAALSFSDYRFISEDGYLVGRRLRGPNSVSWAVHHMSRYLGCLTIMVNREICVGFHFPNISPSYRAEDFLAWSSVILQHGPVLRCKYDLARYAVVTNSRSSNSIRAAKSVWMLYYFVENIPLFRALSYFGVYLVSTVLKRAWFKPRWQAEKIDGPLSASYRLKARS